MFTQIRVGLLAVLAFLSCLQVTLAAADDSKYVTYTNAQGEKVYLLDDRKPSLYTQNFGDCLGGSTINVTRFDAAYYQDNMTVLFHLAGNSGVANDSLMMYIGVFAYGEDRFDLIFNPCDANIDSLCPLNSSVPITASGIIPVAPSDVANIPPIAFSIPDFEGQAILRIFSNLTHEEIACYSAVVTNGASFGQPESVGSILGIFTFVALLASFATAVFGEAVPTMRLHYAHSLSVGVVFAVWQHIFFSGALSVNWPSVLVAWWSNFAWAGGMIYSSSMQSSINRFIGNDIGNTSQVGAAQAGSANSGVGGGYDISMIYKRAFSSGVGRAVNHPFIRDIAAEIYQRDYSIVLKRDIVQRRFERALQARDSGGDGLVDASEGFKWYGRPVGAGFPLPGNYSGFAGTLAEEGISVANAFMTGFLWFLIALVLLVACIVGLKWFLEGLARIKWIKEDRLRFFRDHWLGYAAVSALRVCFIAWFMIMFLTIFQFTFQSSGGVVGVAVVVFTVFFLGMPTIAAYAWWYKHAVTDSANHLGEHKMLLGGKLPIPRFGRKKPPQATTAEESDPKVAVAKESSSSKPGWIRKSSSGNILNHESEVQNVHDDEDYTMKFGWLASRFRRTRWWFFAAWLFYEFLRAVFYGAGSGYVEAQVFGLLVVEVLAFCLILWARPYEGQRLNILVVYCLGFSKVTTVGLSAAFNVRFNLDRITTTAIGIVIVVIQGILTIITMIAIIVGAISSYMSVSRNHAEFRPRKWHGLREKYFDHLDRTVNDLPRPPKPKPKPKPPPKPKTKSRLRPRSKSQPEPEVAVAEPQVGFEMKNVRRMKKIEDEDAVFMSELGADANAVHGASTPTDRSRPNSRTPSLYSISSTNLPYGARPHRLSWSSRDYTRDSVPADSDIPPVPALPASFIGDRKSGTVTNPIDPSPSPGKNSRTLSRRRTLPANLNYKPSTDSIKVGGDVSTLDTIGKVPAPTVRPRAVGDRSSWGGSLRSSNVHDGYLPDPQPVSRRTSGHYGQPGSSKGREQLLTPSREVDEFTLSKLIGTAQ